MNSKTALLLGGSGLVGRFCFQNLISDDHYEKIIVLTRRPLPADNTLKVKQMLIDFAEIDHVSLDAIDDVFCALGTTIGKAGSQEAFRRIDLEIPLAAARRSLEFGAQQFILVSSVGASSQSRNFYLRTKGELEDKLGDLPFKAIHIFRPSFLVGSREESRLGERLAIPLARVVQYALVGGWRRYRPIQAADVACAMVEAAKSKAPHKQDLKSQAPNSQNQGKIIYEYDQIRKLAAK